MSIPYIARRLGGLLFLLLVASVTWADNSDAYHLLKKMSEVGHSLSYQGSFTYEHGSSMESFRVVRWTEEGAEFERLEHLSGPARQIVRHVPTSACSRLGGTLFQNRLARLTSGGAEIDQYYRLVLQGRERVAGRDAQVVQIIPRDQMRYGYVVSLDRETGMLLKSLLLDEQQRMVERFQFIDFTLSPDVASLEPEIREELQSQASADDGDCAEGMTAGPRDWTFQWLPPGFEFSGERQVNNRTHMLMYTDGLATFSIFIQPRGDQFLIEGRAQRGATTAYMGAVSDGRQDYRLTVVGEVPSAVAEQLAQSLRPRAADARTTGQSGAAR
ncbi:MucB/RseB C-terminal domain-containing protein [Marinimicrobium sp. ABcell2]|uniref:MucB/RseB C-terminal domain-containing protein n=1 Tax=Marinimicrobium sp. ABcell2 TaxID=3069751 RepID=UPI0027B5ACE8|nr:MucB/RseB C-terminal domain-containing protein [Marinimicrobium sp. ABcell2]MDQ2075279.1 MucB/RseB C-terminal domain-containing protein [Marinimicrobium sp. ABcell2]